MSSGAARIGEAVEAIERSVLPSLSHLLDGLLDCAALARPGADADLYATELRYTALQVGALTRLVEATVPLAQAGDDSLRMSA